MKNKVIFLRAFALVLATLLVTLASCAERPDETVNNWEGVPKLEADGDYYGDPELLNRFVEYDDNSALAFSQNRETDGSLFVTEDMEGGVKIISYIGSENIVVIPEKIDGKAVVALGESSFAGALVRAVRIPDSVTLIEKGAFADCDNLATLRIPFVGDGGENDYFGYIFGADGYEEHAIKVPAALDMVIIGDGVSEIADNAFAGCKSLSAVVFSEKNLEKIGRFAFYECRDIVYITQINSVKSVGEYAFAYCSSLVFAQFDAAESISFGAFFECDSLRGISLSFVGDGGENTHFGYIFGAESADYNDEFVPKSLRRVRLNEDCTIIPDRAFANCAYIAEISLESSRASSIGVRAFYGCRSLDHIILPDTVKSIGDDAFFGCDNLETVELGSGLESIGMQAFFGCRSLKSIAIPDKVTELSPSTFAYCESLESVDLGNVKKIGKDAFWGCDSLIAVSCEGIEIAEGNDSLIYGGQKDKEEDK